VRALAAGAALIGVVMVSAIISQGLFLSWGPKPDRPLREIGIVLSPENILVFYRTPDIEGFNGAKLDNWHFLIRDKLLKETIQDKPSLGSQDGGMSSEFLVANYEGEAIWQRNGENRRLSRYYGANATGGRVMTSGRLRHFVNYFKLLRRLCALKVSILDGDRWSCSAHPGRKDQRFFHAPRSAGQFVNNYKLLASEWAARSEPFLRNTFFPSKQLTAGLGSPLLTSQRLFFPAPPLIVEEPG
jgi:hypothetical protein